MPERSPSYKAGYDCGYTKATTSNCHFSFFGSPESSSDWQAGHRQGEADRNRGKKRKYVFDAQSPPTSPLRTLLAQIAGK